MRAMVVVFGIGIALWGVLGSGGDAEPTTQLEHVSAVSVEVGAGPQVGTARNRQLSAAVLAE